MWKISRPLERRSGLSDRLGFTSGNADHRTITVTILIESYRMKRQVIKSVWFNGVLN